MDFVKTMEGFLVSGKTLNIVIVSVALLGLLASAAPGQTVAAEAPVAGDSFLNNFSPDRLVENATSPEKLSSSLEILVLMTVLALTPTILVMTTCFVRIIVVLSLLRQAMGTQQLPPSQVITVLALFMTVCVMAPTWRQINDQAITPYVNPPEGVAAIDRTTAWNRAVSHMRGFMIKQIENTDNSEDVYMFVEFNNQDAAVTEKIRDGNLQWNEVSTAS